MCNKHKTQNKRHETKQMQMWKKNTIEWGQKACGFYTFVVSLGKGATLNLIDAPSQTLKIRFGYSCENSSDLKLKNWFLAQFSPKMRTIGS